MQLAALLVAITLAVQTPDETLGSFTIAGQTSTVIVRNQQLEIRDQSNAVQYRKAMQPGVSATAKLAAGNGLAGLLMHYTNDNGESWQLFRLRDGKLGLFDPPMNAAPVTVNAIVAGAASAIVKWSTSGDEFAANLSDIWLKVLIDNNEDNLGWIHTEEDFAAVGLPRQRAER